MLVQPVVIPGSGTRSWTVLGDDDVPVVPVDRFLAYLTDIGRSPNTVKAYAHDLKDYWDFIRFRALDWREARLEDAGDGRHLLIRRSLSSGELAYYLCWSPRAVTLTELVKVAGARWAVEECLCATRRFAVFPVQPGGTRREVPGSDGLPGAERLRGQEHARKPAAAPRRMGRGAGRPA